MSRQLKFKSKQPSRMSFYAHVNEDKTVTIGIECKTKKKTVVHVYFLSRRRIKSLAKLLASADESRLPE